MITRAYIDMDGILADLWSSWKALHAEVCDNVDIGHDHYDAHRNCGECDRGWFFGLLDSAELFEGLEPIAGGLEAMRRLGEVVDVYIASSPPSARAAAGKLRWIERHLGVDWRRRTILIKDKHLLAGRGSILVDDASYQCELFMRAGGRAATIAYPHNRDLHGFVPRFASHSDPERAWADILAFVEDRAGVY